MRATEILDAKIDLIHRLTKVTTKTAWRQQLILDLSKPLMGGGSLDPKESLVSGEETLAAAERAVSIDRGLTDNEVRGSAAAMIEALRGSLPECAPFFVTREMAQMTIYAASQLDSLDRIDRTVLPTRSGLVRFDGGLPFTDVRGRAMRISWLAWVPILTRTSRHDVGEPVEAVLLFMWNDHREEPDEIYAITKKDPIYTHDGGRSFEETFGRWGFMGVEPVHDGTRLGPMFAVASEEKIAEIVNDGDVPAEFTNPIRLAHAFWLLVGQTVAAKTPAHLDRATRKRAERAEIPSDVTVISLRNTETRRAEGESLVEWSKRWMVRGFWRWQVCGPGHELAQEIEPGKYRARIWVAPFVKGPADKPLVLSEKVYAVRR